MPELPARLAAVLERRRDAVEAWGFKLRGRAEAAGAGALRLLRAPLVMVRPENPTWGTSPIRKRTPP